MAIAAYPRDPERTRSLAERRDFDTDLERYSGSIFFPLSIWRKRKECKNKERKKTKLKALCGYV